MSDNKQEFDIIDFAAKISKWLETHFKKILAVFVAIIVASSAWAWMKSVQRTNEKKAFDSLFEITKVYNEKKSQYDEAEQTPADPKKEAKPKAAKTGDMEKDYPGVAEKLEAFVKANADYKAAGEAALILSELYSEYGQSSKGAQVVSDVSNSWNDKDILFKVLKMRAGDLWAESGDCEKAVTHWQVVAGLESFIQSSAQLKTGVCLQKLGKVAEARTWFEKVKASDPNSTEGFNAKRYLRFLDFKTRNGEDEDTEVKAQKEKNGQDKES